MAVGDAAREPVSRGRRESRLRGGRSAFCKPVAGWGVAQGSSGSSGDIPQRAADSINTEDTETYHRDSQRNRDGKGFFQKLPPLQFLCESLCYVSVFSVLLLLRLVTHLGAFARPETGPDRGSPLA